MAELVSRKKAGDMPGDIFSQDLFNPAGDSDKILILIIGVGDDVGPHLQMAAGVMERPDAIKDFERNIGDPLSPAILAIEAVIQALDVGGDGIQKRDDSLD